MYNNFTKRAVLLSLLLLLTTHYSLLAFSVTKVPGNLKDINASSKAWLSTNEYPITFYTKDTNLSLMKKATFKILTNGSDIALLIRFDKSIVLDQESNNSFEFSSQFSKYNITDIANHPINYINIKKSHTVSSATKDLYNDDNKTILSETTTTSIDKKIKYAYNEVNDTKTPFLSDENSTLNIGMEKDTIYIVKSIDTNSSFVNISFGIRLQDSNNTLLYKTKWIKANLMPNSNSDITSTDNTIYDLQNGKKIFLQNCIACHRYNDNSTAPKGIAPMLTNIGGWANKEYIVDSLLHPQKYISSKYKKLINEGKIMPMPSFEWLDKDDFNDLLSFLQRLKS